MSLRRIAPFAVVACSLLVASLARAEGLVSLAFTNAFAEPAAVRAIAPLLDGVNVASLALMGVVTWQLGAAALVDRLTVLLALTAAILLLRYRLNSAWLVLGGAAAGLLTAAFRG